MATRALQWLLLIAGIGVLALVWHERNARPAAAAGALPQATGAAPARGREARVPHPSAARSDVRAAPPHAAPTEGLPLPPPDAPLRDSFAALDQAARRGSVEAACRLGAALARCRYLAHALPWERGDASPSASANARALAQAEADCAGFDAAAVPSASHYLALAARRGQLSAMLEYLEPIRLGAAELLADPAQAALYREQAPRFFLQLLEAGELGALPLWIDAAHFPDDIALAAALPREWRDAGLTRALYDALTPAQRDALAIDWSFYGAHRAPPSDAQRAAAARLYERYFVGARRSAPALRNPRGQWNYAVMLAPARLECASAPR